METITVIKGDITRAEVDAIVNAANSRMLGGGGVDGAIHRAAGPRLLEACRQVPARDGIRCPAGEARITKAGNLKAKYVIHTVGPRYGIDPDHDALLRSAYTNCLELAVSHNCRSIAFPAVSCGVYGYPPEEAARVSISVCRLPDFSNVMKTFYLFSDEMTDIWNKELGMAS